ncbi:hypothetical protein Prudu_443S000500 [Prunus dulcis]|uniref:Uncharacterized protein n=1 Tax=Prunus dulcis TaxID=3755 RepID=A0A5H2XJV3_PRUDU|nr:hypothetical protein Prudu_443S000500 [Prunus dulcis]
MLKSKVSSTDANEQTNGYLVHKDNVSKFEQELIESTACFLELKTEDACKVVFNVSERKIGKQEWQKSYMSKILTTHRVAAKDLNLLELFASTS